MRWNIGALVASAILSTCAIIAPVPTLLVLGGLLVGTLFLVKPKLAVGFSVLVILFGTGVETATGIGMIGYADEALVLASFVAFTGLRLIKGLRPRMLPGGWWLALFIVLGVISAVLRDVPGSLAMQSLFLTLKGFVFAFAVAQLNWNARDVRKIVKPSAAVLIFVLLVSFVNLAIPELWTSIIGRATAGVSYRLGLPSLIGPFDHPVAYGQFMALAFAAIVAYRANVRKGSGSAILLAGSAIGVLLSFRRKAIAAAVAAALTARSMSPGKGLNTALSVAVVLPLALLIGWDSLTSVVQFTYNEYFLEPGETARTLLYRDSVVLSLAYFPFGAGFGRFGSFTASQTYSPEYVSLGYGFVYKMGPGEQGGFLSDTFWPAILGEAGVIGLVAFVMAVIMLARTGSQLARTTMDPHVRWLGIVSVVWFLEFTIESVAAPSFNSPPLYALLFAIAGISTALHAEERAGSRAISCESSALAELSPGNSRQG